MPLETPSRIEPTRLDDPSEEITDAITELASTSAILGKSLHPKTAENLASLVRLMNTYYSNLIEGHNTRPKEIERAMSGDLDAGERRNLQIEAAAHLRVQAEIDRKNARGELPSPVSEEFIRWLHREFYRDAPEDSLAISGPDGTLRMRPGDFRSTAAEDVAVGRHVPPSHAALPAFMKYFEATYAAELRKGKTAQLIAIAAAHHRFNYIHPFPDGNGRVSRLMSHAMALQCGVGAHGLWSVSRGLARGLRSRQDYKTNLDLADAPRENDLDGRGNLSKKALSRFVLWFLEVAVDQVMFMTDLFDLNALARRFEIYAERTPGLKPEAARLLIETLLRGEVERGEIARITGLPERSARRVFGTLSEKGLLASDTPKGPVSLRFPADTLDALFPELFPET